MRRFIGRFGIFFSLFEANFAINFRGVAQLVARLVWDQEVAGSNPAAPRLCQIEVAANCKTAWILEG
jgi:hypothetical protein